MKKALGGNMGRGWHSEFVCRRGGVGGCRLKEGGSEGRG